MLAELEVLFVRVPIYLKIELEQIAAEHNCSVSYVTARALEVYLSERCGRVVERPRLELP